MKKQIKLEIKNAARVFAPIFKNNNWEESFDDRRIPYERDIENRYIMLCKELKNSKKKHVSYGRLTVCKHNKNTYGFLLEA